MSHVMLEMAARGIPVTEFKYAPERLAAAAKRLHLTASVVGWFETDMGRAAQE